MMIITTTPSELTGTKRTKVIVMDDIHIERSGIEKFTIKSLTPKGCKWLKENMMDTVIIIASEFVEEIIELIQKSGLTIERK